MKLKTILFTAAGFFLLILGGIGLFLPVWPTTPFVLLAAGCFSVNPKLKALLMSSRFFSQHFHNYKHRTGLPLRNLIFSLSFLWTTLLISMLVVREFWVVLLLSAVGIAVTVHLLCMARPKSSVKRMESR